MTKLQVVTISAWVLSIPYYFTMENWAQRVIAPIRIDLLIVYSVLALLSTATLIQWFVYRRNLR